MENFPTLSTWELILRVVVAGSLGGSVGFEREFSDQPAGFRTHILVSLGAALFTMVGAYGVDAFFGEEGVRINFDPTRVAAQVVTGIGFLGAGAILREGANVRGLTTAASLWVTAAIGTAVALGYYVGAVAVTVATVLALYGLKRLEGFVFPRIKKGLYRFRIELGPELKLTDLAERVEGLGVRVESMRIVSDEDGDRHLAARFVLPPSLLPDRLAEEISEIDGVTSVDFRS